MELEIILGLVAGILTTLAYLPQLIKIWKTKSTKDISLTTFIVFCIGTLLWLIYGLIINSLPLIAANSVSLITTTMIVFFKLKYK